VADVWWLTVFFLIQGEWVPGSKIDGWSPRAFPTEVGCLEHRAFAEKACEERPLNLDTVWTCNYGEPLNVLPKESYPTIDC
jgi:hypothetical protein